LPIVYKYCRNSLGTPFEAELFMSDLKVCESSVPNHVTNILASLDTSSSELDQQDRRSVSHRVLKGLLCDVPMFASDQTLKAFFSQAATGEIDIHAQWVTWQEERRKLAWRKMQNGISAPDPVALWSLLAPYAEVDWGYGDSNSGLSFDPSSMVDHIEISCATRLRLSLGDLPGLGDINVDPETKSRGQLDDCNIVAIVEEISRAADSAFLKEFLAEYHRKRPQQRVIVALTKCERDIDVDNRLRTTFSATQTTDLDTLNGRKK
jgi:hypothetical protein